MKFVEHIIRGSSTPLIAGAVAVVYLVLVGFRGLGKTGVQWLQNSRQLAIDLAADPALFWQLSAADTPLVELAAAGLYLVSPRGSTEWILFGLSVLAGAVATSLVFYLARRLAGPLGGWMALFFLIVSAPWIGLFTRLDPTFALVPVLLAALCVWYAPGPSWWQKTLTSAPLWAVSILLWTGTLVVLGLVLAVALLAPVVAERSEHDGLFAGATLTLDRLATPAAALGLLLLYPLFWPAPVEGLLAFLLAAVDVEAPSLVFRGHFYPPHRPPWYFGLAWLFEQLPLALVIAYVAGFLWAFIGVHTEARQMALSSTAVALALLAMPVFFRSPRPLGAEFGVLFVAFATPIASLVVCRFFSLTLGLGAPSTKVRQVAVSAFVLAGISILVEAPRAMESPETFRSPMTARIVGWSAAEDMPLREEILPLRLIEISGARGNARLYVGSWGPYLRLYERMGLLTEVRLTEDRHRAHASIRQVPPVFANQDQLYDSGYDDPLDDATTTVVPNIHRPLFLLDRRVRRVKRSD